MNLDHGGRREGILRTRLSLRWAAILLLATLGTGLEPARAGINEWTPVGPYGGIVTTLAADPRNPGTLYAASRESVGSGRLYKTTDGGANWILLNSALGAASIAIDPQNTNTVYIGLRGSSSSSAWVFKSPDGGASFRLANSGLEVVQFHGHLAADPTSPGTLYAAMIVPLSDPCMPNRNCNSTQVFKTTDGGESWTAASAGLPQADFSITALAVDPQDGRLLYAGATNGIFKSTWSVGNYTYRAGLFKSTNGGTSWKMLNTGLTPEWNFNSLAIDLQDSDTVYLGTNTGVLRSTDGGETWSAVNSGLPEIFVSSLAIDPQDPNRVYAGTDAGLFVITLVP